MITVIIGPKGSGKTTVALGLINQLRHVHKGVFTYVSDYAQGRAAYMDGYTMDYRDVDLCSLSGHVYITARELTNDLIQVADRIIEITVNNQ